MNMIKIPRGKIDWAVVEGVITKFIRDCVKEAQANGVVVGLSGGIDSAVVAELCRRALPVNDLHVMLLPYDAQSITDALFMVDNMKLCPDRVRMCNISEAVDAIARPLFLFEGQKNPLPFANIMPRVRMTYLYAYANAKKLLVVGTSNRSEFLTGYFTKYGDGGVDIEPIEELYKTEVFAFARHLGIPERIIKKKPSAELYDGQTDEGELGIKYKTLDRILQASMDPCISGTSAAEDAVVSLGEVLEVRARVGRNRHKREMPPVPGVF